MCYPCSTGEVDSAPEPPSETVSTIKSLIENLVSLRSMAEKCDREGMSETPQKEWTPYQGKIMAYDYCIEQLNAILAQRPAPSETRVEVDLFGHDLPTQIANALGATEMLNGLVVDAIPVITAILAKFDIKTKEKK
jgi:hypothetical protein